jgi:hypothetical protein
VPGRCTGCEIEIHDPVTTFFAEGNQWTSFVITETVLSEFTTYMKNNATIDTIVTSVRTVNQTRTIINNEDQTITRSTPAFTITPKPGTYLTLDAGPTYVIYKDFFGALDSSVGRASSGLQATVTVCSAQPTQLKNWEPVRTEDWSYFIQTHTEELPKMSTVTNITISVPSSLLQYLDQNLAMRSQYNGSNIATCTFRPTGTSTATASQSKGLRPMPKPTSKVPLFFPPMFPPFFSISTQTFLSTTYESTSTHVTVVGCLRKGCEGTQPTPTPSEEPNDPNNNINGAPDAPSTPKMPNVAQPTSNPDVPSKPDDTPGGPSSPDDNPNTQNTPDANPSDQSKPGNNVKPIDQRPSGVPVTIGSDTFTLRPAQPTPISNPDRPSEQDQAPPVIVIGTQTLTQGQSTVINGVPVVVPSDGGGTRIVVGGTTIAVNNGPTGAPILTVGQTTVTANPQGQFVVGTETLKPGGPAITVDGSTLSLAPSGAIAIVNGVTQTLAQEPAITPPPVLTVGGRVISATVLDGTTQYMVGSQTLAPGSPITLDGTTFELPSAPSARIVLVNGATSTLTPGQPLGAQLVTATLQSGTTAYVFAAGQTLTPGGVLTIAGTTFSMPASGSGSVVVINGVSSTLLAAPATTPAALTINGKTYTASVRSGTREFVLAPGVTLRPGQAVTMAGTTYSLDPQGSALVVDGTTSSLPRSVSARTTSATSSSGQRDVGNFVWSGLGGGSAGAGGASRGGGAQMRGRVEGWMESLVMGIAGWVVMLL